MNDKLRDFIRNNRDAFDTAQPGNDSWQRITRTLDRLQDASGAERWVLQHREALDTAEPPATLWNRIEQQLDAPSDNLESFIRQNRDAFDTATPDLRVWAAVEKSTPAQGLRVGWSRHLMRAAAAIALLIVGAGLGLWYAGQQNTQNNGMTLGQVSVEYAELEHYYQRDIAAKQQQLVAYTGNNSDVELDLQQLDGVMHELQQELANVPPGNREQVVRAMIENYKAKAAILERVLDRLQTPNTLPKTKINSNKNDETESI